MAGLEQYDLTFKAAVQRTAQSPDFGIEKVPDCLLPYFQSPDSGHGPWEGLAREEKVALARAIIVGMDTAEFRTFYFEFAFAEQLHRYAKARVIELLDTKMAQKDRQDSLLGLLLGHIKGEELLSGSFLNGEINAQLRFRSEKAKADSDWSDFMVNLPYQLLILRDLARDIIKGDSRYTVPGYSHKSALELDREYADPARQYLESLGIQQVFVSAGKKDPVDLFLARWGGVQATPTPAEH